jgi:ubiquinone/menaquinone biosynthesis C-methylase UbiE
MSSGGNEMNEVEAHNVRAQAVWNAPAGRYDAISRTIADAIEHAVERLSPRAGERILDLATGTGWASRVVAQRFPGVSVTGADIAEQMLEHARAAAAMAKLDIEYRHADAERLPFADGSFDALLSTFGVMFASNQERAAAEIARVVKPGGRVVLATWKPDCNVVRMFGVMKKYLPASAAAPPRSPFEWGSKERIHELLGATFELRFEEGTNTFRYGSGEQAWTLWMQHYGPTTSLARSLDDAGREAFKRDMVTWHETFSSPLGYEQPRDYLIVQGIRTVSK